MVSNPMSNAKQNLGTLDLIYRFHKSYISITSSLITHRNRGRPSRRATRKLVFATFAIPYAYGSVGGWRLSLEKPAVKAYAKAMLQSQVDKIAASPYSPDYGEQRLDKLLTR